MNSFLEKFEKLNWKIFLIGLLIGIVSVFLVKSGASVKQLVSPLSKTEIKENDTFKSLIPKLGKIQNDYSLKPAEENIVPLAYANNLNIPAFSYIVTDFETGEVLEEKDSFKILPIASLTKVMTAVVALDIASPSEIFTISRNAADKEPTKIGVVTGQKMTLEELLNAALLTSANDAAEAIKDGIDSKYKSKVFIKAMNEKARILGLKNTSFSNAQGFDSQNNYSTASDFAILARYALANYSLIARIVKKDYEFLPENNNHKQFDLYNWNGLLGVYPNVTGVKIGNTDDAQFTTSVVSERNGKKVLAVLLGAPGFLERDLWTSQLLDIGFEKLGLEKIAITEDQLLEKYSTWKYWN